MYTGLSVIFPLDLLDSIDSDFSIDTFENSNRSFPQFC